MDTKRANSGPLGLAGFGMTTILLNIHNAGLFPVSAGIMEYKNGNTFGMLAFTSYGFFWINLVATWVHPKLGVAEASPAGFMGWFLAVWGVFSIFMTIGTLKSSKVLTFVFVTLDILFMLLAIRDGIGRGRLHRRLGRLGLRSRRTLPGDGRNGSREARSQGPAVLTAGSGPRRPEAGTSVDSPARRG